MVMSRKKQCSVSLVCSTLQCTRGTDTNITQTIGMITGHVQSAWQGSNKSCAWVWFCRELPNGLAQKLLNPVLIARHPIPYLCRLFWFRPLYSRTPLDSKVCKCPLDQPNLHGKEQKEAVFCATFLKHFAMYARNGAIEPNTCHGDQYSRIKPELYCNYVWVRTR